MKQNDETKQFMMALGEAVKRHRIDKGLTQEQLAILIGSESENDQRSMISKLEKGLRNPDAFKLAKIAQALGMSPTALMNEAMQIQDEQKVCELFEQCYGKEAFGMVQKFLLLDHVDRIKVEERIDTLLDDGKYSNKKESSGRQIS